MITELDSSTDKLSHLTKELEQRINGFHRSVDWYRRRYYVATMATVLLSALITLIAGWKPGPRLGVEANNLILALGAISTVISVWGAFFSPRESWLLCESTLTRLRALQAKIDFQTRPPDALTADSESTPGFFRDYQGILDTHNEAWRDLRSASKRAINTDARSATDARPAPRTC